MKKKKGGRGKKEEGRKERDAGDQEWNQQPDVPFPSADAPVLLGGVRSHDIIERMRKVQPAAKEPVT